MRGNILEEMLLLQDPSVFKLYKEMMNMAGYFIAPVFTIALIVEYFGNMDFGAVVTKLLIIVVFMGGFYQFHSKAVELSLETASYTLKKVSPRNLFVKKWNHVKVRTKTPEKWRFLESFAIPNLNDLIATAFFLFAKVFIWLLKLIYSTVYHLTYVFSGVTAILYFLGWTKDALKGTVQASVWCMLLPFVVVAILALVGNSIDESALSGDLIIAKMDTIIWLFGVTLLLLLTPVITHAMVKGEGIHSFGAKMGAMVVSSGIKASATVPFLIQLPGRVSQTTAKVKEFKAGLETKLAGGNSSKFAKSDGIEKNASQTIKSQFQGQNNTHETKTEARSTQSGDSQKAVATTPAPVVTARGKDTSKFQVNSETNKQTPPIPSSKLAPNKVELRSMGPREKTQTQSKQQTETRSMRFEKIQSSSSKTTQKLPPARRDQRELR